jgi:hypothetical protein
MSGFEMKNVRIDYTNWRGERRVRVIRPTGIMMFTATQSHPETQWLMEAFDPEDGKTKYFAVKDMHSWEPAVQKMWTLEDGLALVRKLEKELAPHYHAALGGGVLHRGSSDHDLDIVILPHHANHLDVGEIHKVLQAHLRLVVTRDKVLEDWRRRGITDTKYVEVWVDDSNDESRRVDIIILGGSHEAGSREAGDQ